MLISRENYALLHIWGGHEGHAYNEYMLITRVSCSYKAVEGDVVPVLVRLSACILMGNRNSLCGARAANSVGGPFPYVAMYKPRGVPAGVAKGPGA